MEYYPDNTLTKYTTKLHDTVSLQGEWEVGLSEIIFPKKFYNVDSHQSVKVLYVSYDKLQSGDYDGINELESMVYIRPGYYSNIGSLVNEVNESLANHNLEQQQFENYPNRLRKDGCPRFVYQSDLNVVSAEMVPYCEIIISDGLRQIFGFRPFQLNNWSPMAKQIHASDEICLEGDRRTLYVYCDILENVPVGDTLAPLLRTIDAEAPRGNIIHKNFDRPRYLPIQRKNFSSLEIDIRDGLGRAIPFESGTVIVTLHFKRATSSYFLS
jgi:hypothetical protein